MSIIEKQNQIIEEFSFFEDWMEKYQYIIDLSKDIELIKSEYKTNDYLIDGCQSKVWIHSEFLDGKMHFTVDSDAIITKGIAALLIRVFNHETPKDIIHSELFFVDKIGLEQNLSPTRSNGLRSMIKTMLTTTKQYI